MELPGRLLGDSTPSPPQPEENALNDDEILGTQVAQSRAPSKSTQLFFYIKGLF
jgi:hypothetical protein